MPYILDMAPFESFQTSLFFIFLLTSFLVFLLLFSPEYINLIIRSLMITCLQEVHKNIVLQTN